ncbi:hypothetical protein GWI33_022058 [Rhynchophorus ferrugineus]|uniref:Uncharacterized protein n=1 Tax=Rhynchophorus ferrugineus TaxID=354439 RepID=A0A834IQN5_RHYFE|nr:hypothetical protein GWI33_022058 [Rhynchophorus ferrugineus]
MKLWFFFILVLLALQGILGFPSKSTGGSKGGSSSSGGGKGGSSGGKGGKGGVGGAADKGGLGPGDRDGNTRIA